MYYARYRRRKIYCFEQAWQVLEEDMEEAFKRCRYHSSRSNVSTDLSEKCEFYELPHLAFSGKNLRKAGKKSKISGSIESTITGSAFYEPSM